MDLRTGKTYESREAAMADGVPEADVFDTRTVRDAEFHKRFENKKYPAPHQGDRERQRRMRRAVNA